MNLRKSFGSPLKGLTSSLSGLFLLPRFFNSFNLRRSRRISRSGSEGIPPSDDELESDGSEPSGLFGRPGGFGGGGGVGGRPPPGGDGGSGGSVPPAMPIPPGLS